MATFRCYSDLIQLPSYEERFRYLRMNALVGAETFGAERYLNQSFYSSQQWKHIRDIVIMRDCGCDLGCEGYSISGRVVIHHMNPITIEDIVEMNEFVLNPEYLITTTPETHNAIHYGDESLLILPPVERETHDTCPWKKKRTGHHDRFR